MESKKKVQFLLLLAAIAMFWFAIFQVQAEDNIEDFSSTKTQINRIQSSNPSLPSSQLNQKGEVGNIISKIFDTNWKIGNIFLKLLWTRSNNAVLRWSGWDTGQFVQWSIFDNGTNVSIWGVPNSYKLNVVWDINFTGNIRRNGVILDLAWKFQDGATSWEIYYNGWNVGIGTNNPNESLEVSGKVLADNLVLRDSYQNRLWLYKTATSTNYSYFRSAATWWYFGWTNGGAYMASSWFHNGTDWYTSWTYNALISTHWVNWISFFTDDSLTPNTTYTPTERMRITSWWNVGIWNISPTQALDVNWNIRTSGVFMWNGSSITNINGDNIQNGTIDSSEIQDNTLTSSDILNNTIDENDISDSFIARNSNLLDWYDTSTSGAANSVVVSNGSADIFARLFRSSYGWQTSVSQSADIAFRNNNSNDNYIRFTNRTGLLGYIGKVNDSDTLDGIDSTSFIRSDVDDTITGKIVVWSTATRRAWMYGIYDSTKVWHIWSMWTGYQIPEDGSDFGNLYGLAYKHTNNPTWWSMAWGHQMVWTQNGIPNSAMWSNIWTSGQFIWNGASITNINGDNIQNGTIDGSEIQDNTITGPDIAANSINGSELNSNAVTSWHIVDNSITAADIAANAITSSELAGNSVGWWHILNGSITAADIAPNAIWGSELTNTASFTMGNLNVTGTIKWKFACRRVVSAQTFGSNAVASCASNEFVMSWGGSCKVLADDRIETSIPLSDLSWWSVNCRTRQWNDAAQTAYAICCDKS